MQKYRVVLTLSIFLLSACSPASVDHPQNMNVENQTKTDRQQLIQKVLEYALIEEKTPDFNLIHDKKNIVLSTKNVSANEIPEIDGTSFLLLTEEQIQEKANQDGDFLYLQFQEIELKGNEAVLSLDNRWAVSKKSQEVGMGYLSGGGIELRYHKKSGQWILDDEIKQWIS